MGLNAVMAFLPSRRFAAAACAALNLTVLPVAAQSRQVSVVRDAETEGLVRDYTQPIFNAAGLASSGIRIVIVNDPNFNAFVAGRRLFINTGTLMTADTPNEVIGVIAHECGHIAGHHEQAIRDQLAHAQTMAIVTALLGLGASALGAATNSPGLGQAGNGLVIAGPGMAQRGLLSYQRSEEVTADRAALTYLEKAHQSAKGLLTTFKRFQSSLSLSGVRLDPYLVDHPLPEDRLASIEDTARKSPYFDRKDPPELQLRHDLVRAKIAAYTLGQGAVARMYRGDPGGLPARYAETILAYLHGNPRDALNKIDSLIKARPRDPYFYELRGDILIKANRPQDAASSYATAVRLDPDHSGLLRIGHAQALLATGRAADLEAALGELRIGLQRAPEYAEGYLYLAQAYGRAGDIAQADLATAEGHFHSGNYQEAKVFAIRAQRQLKHGSPDWLRAQDIINYRTGK